MHAIPRYRPAVRPCEIPRDGGMDPRFWPGEPFDLSHVAYLCPECQTFVPKEDTADHPRVPEHRVCLDCYLRARGA